MDRFLRWLTYGSITLFLVSGALLFSAMAMPLTMPPFVLFLGILSLIGALTLWLVVLLDRSWRSLVGSPPRDRSLFAPSTHTYTCPKCGYQLRGVKGVFCPECGEVRPAPLDGDETD